MGSETSGTRLPFYTVWTIGQGVRELLGPVVTIAALAWLVRQLMLGFGTMLDNVHIGPTVVGGLAACIALFWGAFTTKDLVASLRSLVLRGDCPRCGVQRLRRFENPANPKSPPTACGACIGYLRADGTAMREERADAYEMIRLPYALIADQYKPAAKVSGRGYYHFEMPTLCAVCGDPNARHHRAIGNGDAFERDMGVLGAVVSAAADVADAPSRMDGHAVSVGAGHVSPATDAERNSRALSKLVAPVCAKHTENAEFFGAALSYSSGRLEFAGYAFYVAFCALNRIERASAPTA